MKNKLKLLTILYVNGATDMLKVYMASLSMTDNLYIGNHLMLIQNKIANA